MPHLPLMQAWPTAQSDGALQPQPPPTQAMFVEAPEQLAQMPLPPHCAAVLPATQVPFVAAVQHPLVQGVLLPQLLTQALLVQLAAPTLQSAVELQPQ